MLSMSGIILLHDRATCLTKDVGGTEDRNGEEEVRDRADGSGGHGWGIRWVQTP